MKTHDSMGRRNRYRPASSRATSENRIAPTDGELLMLEAIHRHGPLSSVYLAAFRGAKYKSAQNTVRRLTVLSHEANTVDGGVYLTRPPQQKRTEYAHSKPLIYDLAPAGIRCLKRLGRWSDFAPSNRNPWLHATMVSAITTSIELGAREAGLRYIPQHEILERSGASLRVTVPYEWEGKFKTAALIPDALFALDYGGKYRAFVVEVDRCTEPVTSYDHRRKTYKRSVLQYRNFIGTGMYRNAYGITSNMLVLNVTTSSSRMQSMVETVREVCGANSYICHQMVKALDPVFGLPNVLTDPTEGFWLRAGVRPFFIASM